MKKRRTRSDETMRARCRDSVLFLNLCILPVDILQANPFPSYIDPTLDADAGVHVLQTQPTRILVLGMIDIQLLF